MYLRSTLLLCLLSCASIAPAQDVRSQLQQLAADLAKQVEAKSKKRVVVAPFLTLNNQETELGRYMADKFSIGLMRANTSLQLTDRSQLSQVLRDNKLGADRILDPRTIPTLGKLTGAEVIITGNYVALDNTLDLTVKAIDLERGLTLSVTEGTVSRTPEINRLLQTEVGEPSAFDTSKPTNTPTQPANVPKPAADCAAKSTCVVCATNKSAINIKSDLYYNPPKYLIHPNETKCWQNVSVDAVSGFSDRLFQHSDENNNFLVQDNFVTEACKVYIRTFTK
jgi:hypothetical protein